MDHGIHIEAPKLTTESLTALSGAVNSILETAATNRTPEAVQLAALGVFRSLLPPAGPNLTVRDCCISDNSGTQIGE